MANINENRALAIPEERIKTESDLRTEIAGLDGKYERLRKAYDSILAAIEGIAKEFSEQIGIIRQRERSILESYFPSQERRLLEWIVEEGETELQTQDLFSRLSLEDQEFCKALYRRIAVATHPDKDIEGKYLRLFKEASDAYRKGDIFTLQLIKKELETDGDVYSRRLRSTIDDLIKERDDIQILLSQLNKHIQNLEFGGIKLGNYLNQDLMLDVALLKTDVRTALDIKLQTYAGLEKKAEENQVSHSAMSDETSLILAKEEQGLAIISDNEKENFLKSRILDLVERINSITPYYSGLVGSEIYLRIMSDESSFSERIVIHNDIVGENYRKKRGLPKDDSRLVEFDANIIDRLNFLLYHDDRIVVPRDQIDGYANSIKVLNKFAEVFGKPIRTLQVADMRGNMNQILGFYEEHRHKHLREDYRLSNTSEIITNRLLRALVLLKIPRLIFYEDVPHQYVFVKESETSYRYDGSSGDKKNKDIVEMKVKERDQHGMLTDKEKTIQGRIFTMDDRELVEDRFSRLLGCHHVYFSGHLSLHNRKIPVEIQYSGRANIASAISSIRNTGGFELQMSVNKKNVAIHYDRLPSSREHILSVSGLDEGLLPDLVFKLVENLIVEKVHGKGLFERQVDYL